MVWGRRKSLCLLLILGVLFVGSGWLGAEELPLPERINQLARDINATQRVVTSEGTTSEAGAAAFSKESSTAESIKKAIFRVGSPEEAEKTLEAIRQYSYRVSTVAEKKAVQQTLANLESRLKFMAQTEAGPYLGQLQEINRLSMEMEERKVSFDSAPGARVRQLADQARTSRRSGNDLLGASVVGAKTTFAVYSPAAVEVNVVLFDKAEDRTGKGYPMKKDANGVWRCTIDAALYGKYYGFTATGPQTNGHLFDPKRLISDPCALANVHHDGKSIVVKPQAFTWTDQGFKTPAAKDVIIYEAHVKDLTAHSSSGVSAANKGKYLGLLEGAGSDKVLGHLTDLGINAIELLPIQEFDNNFAGHMNHWGYMTSHYFAPETNFASGKNGEGILEVKKMVNGLHKAGIAVIMDVVYNHTAEGNEKGIPLNFKALDNPGYYRLCDDPKFYWNGTGCGNEFRSDNPMTRKYILDSLKYWSREFHIDGFRFDLGTILDKETITAILNELPPATIIVAEPWAADWKRNQWGKTDFRNTKLGKWNDDFREKIRGFMWGKGERNDVMTVLAGSCFWWSAKPSESVNYIECHDGATVADLFQKNKARIKIGAAALLTGQGIPMIHEGQEFMKDKKGNDNSYDQDNEINWINWSVKRENIDIYHWYKGLIALRRKHDNFRHGTALNNQSIDWIQPANTCGLGYHLKGQTDFLILFNTHSSEWISFNLPGQTPWIVVCNGDKIDDAKGLGTAAGDYKVPPLNVVILKNK